MFLGVFFHAFSLSAQTPPNALPPLAPAYGEIRPGFWEQHGTAILVAGFLLMVLAGGIAWLISHPKPLPVAPPEIVARDALVKLRAQPENGVVLSKISQALRRYVMAAFNLPPGEPTSAEFAAMLEGNDRIGAGLAQTIPNFLRECDQRKFSPADPAAPLNAADRALEIVAAAEQQRARLRAQEVKQP